MTEQEWLTSEDPQAMLRAFNFSRDSIQGRLHPPSDRKLRLFACACADLFGLLGHYGEGGISMADPRAEAQQWARQARGDGGISGKWSPAAAAALLRDIAGCPWISFRWSGKMCLPLEEAYEIASGNGQDKTAQKGHAESLDQGGGSGRLEDASGMELGTGRGASGPRRIPDPPHQRGQSGRQTHQLGVNLEGCTSAIPRRQVERKADGEEVSATRGRMRRVWDHVHGFEEEPESILSHLSEEEQKGSQSKAIPENGKVILLDRKILTPTVLTLARAAYEERRGPCPCLYAGWFGPDCQRCGGTGNVGTLDPARLAVLSDALEEAGCPAETYSVTTITGGSRCPKCGDAGFWRAGVHFDHEKMCRNERCGETWEPGREYVVKVATPHPLLTHLRFEGPHVRGCWAIDLILGHE